MRYHGGRRLPVYIAQLAERKALNFVAVDSSPTVGEALFWGCNVGDHDPRLPECAVPRKPKGVGGGRTPRGCLSCGPVYMQLSAAQPSPSPPPPPPSLPLAWDCVVEMTGVFV